MFMSIRFKLHKSGFLPLGLWMVMYGVVNCKGHLCIIFREEGASIMKEYVEENEFGLQSLASFLF